MAKRIYPDDGEVIAGKIKVWTPAPFDSADKSILWLVESLKDGKAHIYRTCDINRVRRGLQPQLNKCEMWYHRSSYMPDFVEDKRLGMKYAAVAQRWADWALPILKGLAPMTEPPVCHVEE